MQTKEYTIKSGFARKKHIPTHFAAVVLKETDRAVYLYGERMDGWLPKGIIIDVIETTKEIDVPRAHPMVNKEERYAMAAGKRIKVTFPYKKDDPETEQDLENVRSIPGREFNRELRCWSVPFKLQNIKRLQKFGFKLDRELIRFKRRYTKGVEQVHPIMQIPGLGGTLRPFQGTGVGFIEVKEGRVLIADEMGLGKTIQTLAWLQYHPEKRPVIIVCPKAVKENWAVEANKWLDSPNIQVLYGNDKSVELTGDVIVINYRILPNETTKNKKGNIVDVPYTGWVDYLRDIDPQVVVVDEIHYIKNRQSLRSRGTQRLAKNTNHVIGLSGTPVEKAAYEAYPALKLINSKVIPGFWEFMYAYTNPVHNGWGWDFSESKNEKGLFELLTSTIMLRRKKVDVAKELPPKQWSYVPMNLNNSEEYEEAEADFIEYIRRTKGNKEAERKSNAEVITRIEGLKQLATKGKLNQAIEWVKDFLVVENKLVVFTTHQEPINRLMEEFEDVAVNIDGSVTGDAREENIRKFNEDPSTQLMIANIIAGGTGLNLQVSSNVALLELPWTAGKVKQAEDRCHRIGTVATSVNIYYLLAKSTIEEKLAIMIDNRRNKLDLITDGSETEKNAIITNLIEEYEKQI